MAAFIADAIALPVTFVAFDFKHSFDEALSEPNIVVMPLLARRKEKPRSYSNLGSVFLEMVRFSRNIGKLTRIFLMTCS